MKKLLFIAMLLFVVPVFGADKTITFNWDQELTPDFAGWKLYQSSTPGGPYAQIETIAYTGTPGEVYTTDKVITIPNNAVTELYFVLTAHDTSGNDSVYSNEQKITFDLEAPPGPFSLEVTVKVQ